MVAMIGTLKMYMTPTPIREVLTVRVIVVDEICRANAIFPLLNWFDTRYSAAPKIEYGMTPRIIMFERTLMLGILSKIHANEVVTPFCIALNQI